MAPVNGEIKLGYSTGKSDNNEHKINKWHTLKKKLLCEESDFYCIRKPDLTHYKVRRISGSFN